MEILKKNKLKNSFRKIDLNNSLKSNQYFNIKYLNNSLNQKWNDSPSLINKASERNRNYFLKSKEKKILFGQKCEEKTKLIKRKYIERHPIFKLWDRNYQKKVIKEWLIFDHNIENYKAFEKNKIDRFFDLVKSSPQNLKNISN